MCPKTIVVVVYESENYSVHTFLAFQHCVYNTLQQKHLLWYWLAATMVQGYYMMTTMMMMRVSRRDHEGLHLWKTVKKTWRASAVNAMCKFSLFIRQIVSSRWGERSRFKWLAWDYGFCERHWQRNWLSVFSYVVSFLAYPIAFSLRLLTCIVEILVSSVVTATIDFAKIATALLYRRLHYDLQA